MKNCLGAKGRAHELCGSRGGRPGLPSLISPTVSVDVKQHSTQRSERLVPNKPYVASVGVKLLNNMKEEGNVLLPSDSVAKPAMTHAVSENRGGSLSHLGTVSGETVVVLALDAGTSLHHVHASRMWCRPLFCLVVCVPRRGVGRSECVC